MNETNWSTVFPSQVSESEKRSLEKAKRIENKRRKEGWRYVNITQPTMKIFVPCDKNGKPTEHGERMIKEQKMKFSSL